jgi:putative hydrolase of the HAD superfamily
MMELRAVLFDLDDTLHDKSATLQVIASSQFTAENLARYGIDEHAWQHTYLALNNLHIGKEEVFFRLGKQFRLPPELEIRLHRNYDNMIVQSVRAHRGAFAFLNECKSRGLKVGIVTNGSDAHQRKKIAGLGIGHLIDSLVTSGAFGLKKPDHRIFHQCLSELATEARDAAFVGDNFAADMEPALALGMQAVWKSAAESARVSFVSNDLSEIQAFLFADFISPPSRAKVCFRHF